MPIIGAVKAGEDNTLDAVPELTEEDLDLLKNKMAAIDKIFADEGKAKYKIEVLFGSQRKDSAPTPGALSFWESGAKLHGGGDAKIYICAGKATGISDCSAFIPDSSNGYGHLVCAKCHHVWKGEEVAGEVLARLTMQGWAHLIHKYFVKLEHNADIYVKHAKQDIRVKAALEQEKQKGGEELFKARSGRAIYVYPLRNIIRDTAGGADLLKRFYALLMA